MWKWLEVTDHHLRRPQKDVTRDPYIALYCAAKFLKMDYIVEQVTIPFRLRRGGIQRWRKMLIKDKRAKWINRLEYYKSLADVYDFIALYPDDFIKEEEVS